MSLINLTIPLASMERLVRALERIAECCERAFPAPFTDDLRDAKLSPPEPGLTVVTNQDVLEEQTRVHLRNIGYKPDEIEEMIEKALEEDAEASLPTH